MLLLQAENFAFGAPGTGVLASGLSFTLKSGEILWITGANGTGKSTLLRLIYRGLPGVRGALRVQTPRERISILPQLQSPGFHFPATLMDILSIALPKKPSVEEIEEIGLLDSKHLLMAWNTASGGERKRTLLTRILLQRPSLLLLDEPMNHLDQESRQRMLSAIGHFLDPKRVGEGALQRAVVIVSHDPIQDAVLSRFPIVELPLRGGITE